MSALKPFLTNIANAIREKKETTAPIPAQNFANEILSIEGGSKVTDMPLTITENGITEAPEGKRYTPITVAVPKPTLNAPTISVNVSNAVLLVYDTGNGLHTTEYLLYSNGEQVNTFTAKKINLAEYMTVKGDETIQVRCTNNAFFNASELSNAVDWVFTRDGTLGLTYSGNNWTGTGTSTETEVYVASIVNEKVITGISEWALIRSGTRVILPDTVTSMGMYVLEQNERDITFIFGAGFSQILQNTLRKCKNITLDFRKVQKVVSIGRGSGIGIDNLSKIIVPDELYEDWIVATNWSAVAGKIVRASDYEAQGGAV